MISTLPLNYLHNTQGYTTESDIWQAFKKGDQKAYACLFRSYKDILYNYGLTLVSDEEMVCDCIQELFLDLWVKKQNLAQVNSVKYYLLVSYRRLIISKLETARKVTYTFKESATYKNLSNTCSSEMELINDQFLAEQHHRLSATIDHLPKRQKEALYLRYYEKMSYEEIMQVMDLSYKSVRNLVSLAIQALRKELQKHDFIYGLTLLVHLIF
jgi:RNA polymerase sigma-70 factor (ECF subfamily)